MPRYFIARYVYTASFFSPLFYRLMLRHTFALYVTVNKEASE